MESELTRLSTQELHDKLTKMEYDEDTYWRWDNSARAYGKFIERKEAVLKELKARNMGQ